MVVTAALCPPLLLCSSASPAAPHSTAACLKNLSRQVELGEFAWLHTEARHIAACTPEPRRRATLTNKAAG